MAILTIEDFDANINVIIFPSVFSKYQDFLAEEKIFVVEGTTDFSRGDVEIFADRLTPIDDYTPDIYLTLTNSTNNATTKQALKKIFAENQGDSEIYLRQNGRWTQVKNQGKISIDEDVLIELKNLLGAENVRLY